MQAVITADIVNSTKLKKKEFEKLVADITTLYPEPDRIEFYRGDGFQAVVDDGTSAYKKMLLSRLKAIAYSENERIDIRLSIIVGSVNKGIAHLGSHVEDIFIKSGRAFDRFKEEESRRLIIGNEGIIDVADSMSYELIARYTDSLLSQVSAAQAIAFYHVFSGKSQKETAALLHKSAPTINEQVNTPRFEELKDLVDSYETLTKILAHGE